METNTAHKAEPVAWRVWCINPNTQKHYIQAIVQDLDMAPTHDFVTEIEPLYTQTAITQLTTELDAAVKGSLQLIDFLHEAIDATGYHPEHPTVIKWFATMDAIANTGGGT